MFLEATVFSDFSFGSGRPFGGMTTLDGVEVTLTSTNTEPFGATSFRDTVSTNPADVVFSFDTLISEFFLDISFVAAPEFISNFNIGLPTSLSGDLILNGDEVSTSNSGDSGAGRLSFTNLNTDIVSFTIFTPNGGALAVDQFGITASSQAQDDAYEPNNSVEEAFPLEPWTSLRNVDGNGIQKDLDYYEFTIPDNHRLIAVLRNDVSEGDLGLAIVNERNRVLLAQNTPTNDEFIQAVAPTGFGGTYSLTVFGPGTGSEYDLFYATVPANISNLDLSGQYQLGKTEQFNLGTSLDSPYLDSSILSDYSSSISSSSSIFESLT